MVKALNPYAGRKNRNFWKKTVLDRHPLDIAEWYERKFQITELRIATAGSCFAQHIGRELQLKGFKYVDAEPTPTSMLEETKHEFGFGMYSARYGNVYTARQLRQLIDRALGAFVPQEDCWSKDGGWVDPFRPTIEPVPFASREEMERSRQQHLKAVLHMMKTADVFVFTFGLTEGWLSRIDGAAYPIAPGVAGGEYDAKRHRFHNFTCTEIINDMKHVIRVWRKIQPKIRFLFTVSPVPLMATATDKNVIVASSYSKSVLRAVAGQLSDALSFVDYFPSYEIISSHVMRGQFYEPDMRSVSMHGVNHVMGIFFSQHTPPVRRKTEKDAEQANDDVVCDEELLASFGVAT